MEDAAISLIQGDNTIFSGSSDENGSMIFCDPDSGYYNLVYEKDVRKYSRRVRFWGGKDAEVAVVKSFLGANTDNFVKALDRIDREYGSLNAYLRGPLALSDNDIRILRDKYLR